MRIPTWRHTLLASSLMLALSSTAQAASEVDFDLPAAPLEHSLGALAAQSNVQILFSSDIAAGKRTPPLRGRYTSVAALKQLLDRSGLTVQQQDEHTYIVVPENAAVIPVTTGDPALPIEIAPLMVTGEKINRTLMQTQTSVVVNTAEDLREHGDNTIEHVFARTPGVYAVAGNENWGIRGVPVSGFDDQGPATLNGAVSVYVDGAQQPNRALTLSPMSMWDVEQVEVLLGPQSTTQGRNSLAGAVVIQTRNPTFEPSLSAQTRVGNYGESGAAVAGGGSLVDGVMAGRVAVEYEDGDGYIDNITTGGDANPHRNKNARGKLLILPSDDLDVLLTYAFHESHQGDNSILRQGDKVRYYKVASDTRAFDALKQNTGSAKVDYRLGDAWTLTSLTTATQSDYSALLDFDQSAEANEEARRGQETHMFSQEVRLAYQGDSLRGFTGVYYGRTSNAYHDELAFDGSLIGTIQGYTRIHNKALFGELNWSFAPAWTLITGLRYDHETNDTDVEEDFLSGPGRVEKTFDALLPKLGVDYNFADAQYLGFMVQKGYRGGGVNVRAGGGHADYDPEYTTNYEISYRGAWLDDSLRARANLYYTDWKDQQVSLLDNTGDYFQVYNAASSTIRGLEVFVEHDLTRRFTVNAGAAYTDGRYGDFETRDGDLSGESFVYAPKYKVSVGGRYRFDNGLAVTSDVVYQEGSPTAYEFDADGDVIHTRRSDDHVLVNLNAEYELVEGLAVSGYVKNLFDKGFVTNNRGGDIIDVGAPRTVGLVVRYDL